MNAQSGTAERVATAIVKSNFWPGVNPNAVLTLCFLAEAEGHHPAVVYRDYHIMQGKPSKKAEAILRDFAAAGGKVKWHKLDDTCADATFTHPSGEARIEWTIERATKAGLKSPMWTKYPRQMLRSRVISEGVRTVFPGATSGLYEANEVADIVAETPEATDGTDQGQSDERAVSPDGPASYKFPEGPATGITQLKAMARALWREIEGCGDLDELNPLLDIPENRELLKQMGALENPAHREIWEGDGKDNPGLAGLIARKQTEFAQQKADLVRAG